MRIFVLAALAALAGCASQTGIVPMGDEIYMTSRQDNGVTAAVGALKAENLKEAAAFCAGKGRGFSVVGSDDIPRALGKVPQSTLRFKCTIQASQGMP